VFRNITQEWSLDMKGRGRLFENRVLRRILVFGIK
jgi:hypothetical protein